MNKNSKNIEVTLRSGGIMTYDSEFPYYSRNGRALVRTMPCGKNIMVETQNKDHEPVFAGYYSSLENAESYARWMAMGL